MSADQIWVLGVLVATLALLVTERLPSGIVGLLAIGGVMAGNAVLDTPVLEAERIFGGLADRSVITIACMFVISAGISRTGAIGFLTNSILNREGVDPARHYKLMLIFVMVASAFLSNTPLVLIFMPVVLGLASRMKRAPSKLLIPLSFISIMGGMCTLIGTSTNIIVANTLADISSRAGAPVTLTMFDFAPMGIVLAVAGSLFLFVFGERLLPVRASLGLNTEEGAAAEYMTELEIRAGSRFVGKTIGDAFPVKPGVKIRVLQLIRHDVIRAARRDIVLEAGDLLLIKGDPATIVRFSRREDTGVVPAINIDEREETVAPTRRVAMTLVEVVLTPGSRWIDRRVRDVKFGERYGVSVFAVQRHGSHLREKVESLRLKAGDILLIQGTPQDINHLKVAENFLVIEGVQRVVPHTQRAPIALFSVLVFVVAASVFTAHVHVAALSAALIMVLGRCITAAESYDSLDWDVLFLLGGALTVGMAFAGTGLAREVGHAIVDGFGSAGLMATVGAVFCFTALITQVLSNTAAAAVMTPIAYQAGLEFPGAEGTLAFVMAVAYGASCCFLTPIGYTTNLIVYGPGGYRFTDFLRIGLPLTLLYTVLVVLLLPYLSA